MRQQRWLLLGACASVLLMTFMPGCSDSGTDGPRDPGSLPQDNPWGLVGVTTSEFQASLLVDGELTFGEYESAVASLVQCVRDAGVWVSDPEYDGTQFTYLMGGTDTSGELDSVQVVFDGCYSEYLDFVESAWVIQNAPSESEAQLIRDGVGACLRGRGFEISEHPSHAEIVSVLEVGGPQALDCMASY